MPLKEDELTIYSDFLQNHGFEGIDLEIILRELSHSQITLRNKKIVFPKELAGFSPLGNPPAIMMGYQVFENSKYSSFFYSDDEAIHLKLWADKAKSITHPLLLWDQLIGGLEDILTFSRSKKKPVLELRAPSDKVYDAFAQIKALDTFIYSFLTGQGTIIIGKLDEAVSLLSTLIQMLPKYVQQKISVVVNMQCQQDTCIDLAILDPQYVDKIEARINSYLSMDYNILDLQKYTSFGDHSAEITIMIAEALVSGDLEVAKSLFDTLFEWCEQYTEYKDPDLLGTDHSLNFDNADLIIHINERLNLK